MKLILIAAVDEKNGLAVEGQGIPWQGLVPQDIERFHRVIHGHTVILGATTYQEIGKLLRSQPIIVLSRTAQEAPATNAIWVGAPDDALMAINPQETTSFVLGGAQTYAAFMDYADELDITTVHGQFVTDIDFPLIEPSDWTLISERHVVATKSQFLDCTFRRYQRQHRQS